VIYNLAVRICFHAALLIVAAPLLAGQTTTPAVRTANDTSYVNCGADAATSRTVRSDVFTSPDGKRRAYTQVSATPIRPSPERTLPRCINNSRLFVANGGGEFEVVFLQEPSDTETGNALQVVDWSSDGRRLLLELAQWQYESPGVTRAPVIYQADYGVFQQPDLASSFRKEFGLECSLRVHVVGFSSENQVVIETEPLAPEEEEVLAVPSCSRKKSQWVLNVAGESLRPLPETAKIVHNAKIEPQASK